MGHCRGYEVSRGGVTRYSQEYQSIPITKLLNGQMIEFYATAVRAEEGTIPSGHQYVRHHFLLGKLQFFRKIKRRPRYCGI